MYSVSPKSCLFGTVFILSILQFLAISWQFSQKNRDKKKFFSFFFFFQIFGIRFFEHNLTRFEEKNSKISKNFFWSHISCENCHEIAKNRPVDKIKTVPNRQDFELSRTHWFFAFETILLQYISKKPQIIQENFEFLKNGSFWALFSISDWLYTH